MVGSIINDYKRLVKRKKLQYNSAIMYSVKLYFRNLANVVCLLSALLLNIFSWLWLALQIRPQAEPIFLHYNILFGVDYMGEWWRVFYLPGAGLLLLLVNTFISWRLSGRDKFIAELINAATLFCQVFILIAALLLVFLNV